MIELHRIKRTDPGILANMAVHYSHPKGFVGRNICYSVNFNGRCYGHIVGGSCTMNLPGRDEFFGDFFYLNHIVNNIFFHIEPDATTKKYPVRNFAQKTLQLFRNTVEVDWLDKYEDRVFGFESLVELPREGEVYKRDGWIETGVTEGFTCKRTAGESSDSWGGKRVWDTVNRRSKRVFCRLSNETAGRMQTTVSKATRDLPRPAREAVEVPSDPTSMLTTSRPDV